MTVSILYQDETLLAVDKPSGLLVHRGMANDRDTLTDRVRQLAMQKVVHPLHRLDRQTSGVVLFALTAPLAATLSAGFHDGGVRKSYFALVRGVPPVSGRIDIQVVGHREGPELVLRVRGPELHADRPISADDADEEDDAGSDEDDGGNRDADEPDPDDEAK